MNRRLLLLFVGLLSLQTFAQRRVMTWIPPYGINACYNNLTKVENDTWIKDGVTNIGLQFWVPGDEGEVVYVSDYQYKNLGNLDGEVEKIVTWGKTNDVKIMLCLYNVRTGDFDWSIARKAFLHHPEATVENILAIVEKFDLDGVDIDFENGQAGSRDGEDQKALSSFLLFLQARLTA